MMEKPLHCFFIFIKVILFVILLILFCEVFLRLSKYLVRQYGVPEKSFIMYDSDPRFNYRLKPNYEGSLYSKNWKNFPAASYSINHQGFRGKDWNEVKKNDFRIMVIGDSISFGSGIGNEENFPFLLEEYLNSWAIQKGILAHFKVYNLSIPGYNVQQEYFMFMEWAKKIKPNIVIQLFYINDCEACKKYALGLTTSFQQRFPSHLLFLINMLRQKMLFHGLRQPPLDWRVCKKYMELLHQEIIKAGAKHFAFELVEVQNIDLLKDKNNNLSRSLLEQLGLIKKSFDDMGAEYLSILDVLSKYNTNDFMILPDNDHFNAKAHKIIAGALANKIKEYYCDVNKLCQ